MTKQEFLQELRAALSGRMQMEEVEAVINDYEQKFTAGMEIGKSEAWIIEELGSPGPTAEKILTRDSSGSLDGSAGNGQGNSGGIDASSSGWSSSEGASGRGNIFEPSGYSEGFSKKKAYGNTGGSMGGNAGSGQFNSGSSGSGNFGNSGQFSEFESSVNRFAENVGDAVNRRFNTGQGQSYDLPRASVGVRFAAIFIDGLIASAIASVLGFLFYLIASLVGGFFYFGGGFYVIEELIYSLAYSSVFGWLFLGSFYNIVYAVIMWKTNGKTPGKAIMKIRVVKLNGQPLTFGDTIIREVLIKSVANSITRSILNIGSLIWACCTPDRKTVHDMAVQTTVVYDQRYNTGKRPNYYGSEPRFGNASNYSKEKNDPADLGNKNKNDGNNPLEH